MAEEHNDNVDAERIESFLQEKMKQYFDKEFEARIPQQQSQRTREQEAHDLLRETISPIVSPDINNARLLAQSADDKIDFYMGNPDHAEYKDQVEAVFQEALKNNRPTPRSVIYNYLIGKEYGADPVKFNEKREEKHKKQLDHADSAVDFGYGSMPKSKADPLMEKLSNFDKLTADEMAEVLNSAGVTF